jgi:hypothetical protein
MMILTFVGITSKITSETGAIDCNLQTQILGVVSDDSGQRQQSATNNSLVATEWHTNKGTAIVTVSWLQMAKKTNSVYVNIIIVVLTLQIKNIITN